MDEVGFLEDYYFLLRIRYDDNIRIHQDFGSESDDIQVLPCALQVLVENAIKHNFFSEREPLEISIRRNGSYIVVSNPVRPKPPGNDSTHIGLRNLKARYSLLTQQSVEVQNGSDIFLVKLPIVKTVNHDKSSNH
jgi:sensor histidine kinase YesM